MKTIKTTKKSNVRIFLLCLVIVFAMLSGAMIVKANMAAASGDRTKQTDIQKVSNELFGDISIKSSEFLYNLDESPDFIYLEFEDSGYAIFSSKTLDVLEYSLSGTLPYVGQSKKYYTGPTGYHNKVGQAFKNLATGESITTVEAAVIVEQTRTVLANAQTTKGLERQNNKGNTNSITTGISQFYTEHTSSSETELPTKSSNSGGI